MDAALKMYRDENCICKTRLELNIGKDIFKHFQEIAQFTVVRFL